MFCCLWLKSMNLWINESVPTLEYFLCNEFAKRNLDAYLHWIRQNLLLSPLPSWMDSHLSSPAAKAGLLKTSSWTVTVFLPQIKVEMAQRQQLLPGQEQGQSPHRLLLLLLLFCFPPPGRQPRFCNSPSARLPVFPASTTTSWQGTAISVSLRHVGYPYSNRN